MFYNQLTMETKHTTFHYNIANLEICTIPTYTQVVLNVLSRSHFRIYASAHVCACVCGCNNNWWGKRTWFEEEWGWGSARDGGAKERETL